MTDRPVIGLLLALIAESHRWTKLRWDFDHEAYTRAWHITAGATLVAGILIYLEGNIYYALPNLLTWLPPLLLPLLFVQSYGLGESMPVNTFSFLAKHRRKRNLRLGLTETVIHIHFGNVFFVAVLLAATLGSRSNGAASWAFLPGLIVLSGWMLLAASRSRPLALVIALSVAGCIALAGQMALEEMNDWFKPSRGSSAFSPNSKFTMIGQTGTVNLSPDIVWRLRMQGKSPPPRLLRTGSYNRFRSGNWETRPMNSKSFTDLTSRLYEGVPYSLLLPETSGTDQLDAVRKSLPRFNLRGAAGNETPLPLPGDATSLRDFEFDIPKRNGFGTVLIFPKHSVIDGTVLWKGETSTEDPPITDEDTEVWDPRDKDTLDAIVAGLELDREPTLDGKLNRIRNWFQTNFTYSLKLTITQQSVDPNSNTPTAIGQFLDTVRTGHCEYFASATTLLLRRAGIPSRYAVGYALVERDPKREEFVIRGTHGHAWVRVWDQEAAKWLDFDTTPASWIPAAEKLASRSQNFDDWVKRLREDFFLWRNRPANRLGATLVMSAIALGLAAFVGRRLWKSKRRLETHIWVNGYEGVVVRTPLNALEPSARKRLGPRPPGQPLAAWLAGLHATLKDPGALDEAIALHQQLRFDPLPHDPASQHRLAELAKQLESALRRG